MADQKALKISQLTVNYGKTPVLWDISLEVPAGKLVGIVGPNGAGKTTFIKAALGLLKPISGKVEFFGAPLTKVRERVAYVPQRESVDWDFPITVKDLVLMGCFGQLGLLRRPRKADVAAAYHHLEMVGMTPYADRQISQLSGGQQQRIFIARALMQDADIYLLDEPFAGIDVASEQAIMALLRQLKTSGKTIFIVQHDLNAVENHFDWVILLNMRLIACGPVKEAFTPETLDSAYGRSYALFDEALKLSQSKTAGMT